MRGENVEATGVVLRQSSGPGRRGRGRREMPAREDGSTNYQSGVVTSNNSNVGQFEQYRPGRHTSHGTPPGPGVTEDRGWLDQTGVVTSKQVTSMMRERHASTRFCRVAVSLSSAAR